MWSRRRWQDATSLHHRLKQLRIAFAQTSLPSSVRPNCAVCADLRRMAHLSQASQYRITGQREVRLATWNRPGRDKRPLRHRSHALHNPRATCRPSAKNSSSSLHFKQLHIPLSPFIYPYPCSGLFLVVQHRRFFSLRDFVVSASMVRDGRKRGWHGWRGWQLLLTDQRWSVTSPGR